MDAANIAHRYRLLLAEISRRIDNPGKWVGVPGLMDELHSLRSQYVTLIARAN